MPRPLRDRHGIEPENAEDRAVLAAMAVRNGMARRTEAGASIASRIVREGQPVSVEHLRRLAASIQASRAS